MAVTDGRRASSGLMSVLLLAAMLCGGGIAMAKPAGVHLPAGVHMAEGEAGQAGADPSSAGEAGKPSSETVKPQAGGGAQNTTQQDTGKSQSGAAGGGAPLKAGPSKSGQTPVAQPVRAGDLQESAESSYLPGWFGNLGLWGWLAVFIIAALVAVVLGQAWNMDRTDDMVAQAEAAATEIFRKQLTLEQLPPFLQELQGERSKLKAENTKLKLSLENTRKALAEQQPLSGYPAAAAVAPAEDEGPEARLAKACRTAITETLDCMDFLASDPDLKSLDAVLRVREALASAGALVDDIVDGNETAAKLTAELQGGRLDTVLTLPGFLDVYFPKDGWYAFGRAAAAVDSLIRSMLAREQVEVFTVRPLSRLSAPRAEARAQDLRNIHSIEQVRRVVSEQAPFVKGGELIVVDCSAPGWIIPNVGSTPPRLTLYNQSTWN